MKVHPDGALEGSPQELSEYKRLTEGLTRLNVQIRPEAAATATVFPSWFGSGAVTGRPDQFPPLWNDANLMGAPEPTPYVAWANIRDQAEGQWVLVDGNKVTPLK